MTVSEKHSYYNTELITAIKCFIVQAPKIGRNDNLKVFFENFVEKERKRPAGKFVWKNVKLYIIHKKTNLVILSFIIKKKLLSS